MVDFDNPTHEQSRVLLLGTHLAEVEARHEVVERAGGAPIALAWPLNISRALEEHVPDVLIFCVAPGETWGFEACADLRLVDPAHDLPIMLIVADAEGDAVERGLGAGADDVVRDSVGGRELSARISVQMRNRRHRDTLRSLRTERDHLRVKATVDPLTQVLNRGALEEALLAELDRGSPFAVMFLDLDHFKAINDNFGHDVGDAVLRAVGGHLKRTIRSNDIAGRYGGEEFVVGLAGCDYNFAPKIAERHRDWIANIEFPKQGFPERITASIGVAVFNPEVPDSSLSSLLKRADAAVYQAKHRGRNRVILASPLRRSFAEEKSATLAREISQSLVNEQQRANDAAQNSKEAIEAELVKQLNEGNSALPVIPALAMAALRMANTPNVNLTHLALLVEQDPFMAARFLAVANSPMYYRGFRIASTREALMRMGLMQGRELLAAIAHSVALPKYNDLLQRHSEHATLTARCALLVCRELRWTYEPAYLCGLLHNLGEARVLRILADLPTPADGMRVIHDLVERYHTHAGAQLAEKWNLHSDIVQACALHHEERHAGSRPVKVAMLSDAFATAITRPKREPNEADAETFRRLGLTDAQAKGILRSLRV